MLLEECAFEVTFLKIFASALTFSQRFFAVYQTWRVVCNLNQIGYGGHTADLRVKVFCKNATLKGMYHWVVSNKGTSYASGMTVVRSADDVKQYWPDLKVRLLAGEYCSQVARAVYIPKSNGGVRPLGYPKLLNA